MSDNPFVSCPYNTSHRVLQSRIQAHLAKCQKKYPPLVICPYNATHRMEKKLMMKHVLTCRSRKLTILEDICTTNTLPAYVSENGEKEEDDWDD